jgi:hypothetical protein
MFTEVTDVGTPQISAIFRHVQVAVGASKAAGGQIWRSRFSARGGRGIWLEPKEDVQSFIMKPFTFLLTALLVVLSAGCAHHDHANKPMIYRGGQSYDQALHAGDVPAR